MVDWVNNLGLPIGHQVDMNVRNLPFLKRRILLFLIDRALKETNKMKVLAQTSSKNVPSARPGRQRNIEHDNLAEE